MLEWAEIKKIRRWMATLYQIYDSMILKPYLDDIILCYHCKIIFFFYLGVASGIFMGWWVQCALVLWNSRRYITISLQDDNYYNLQKLQQKKKVTLFWKLCNFIFLCAKYCLTQCQLHADTWRCIFLWEWLDLNLIF